VAKVGDGPCKLLLPSGKKVEDAGVSELKDACMAMRVEGVDASTGHSAVASAYEKHLQKIYDSAGKAAVAAYLEAERALG
jgi:hypothetical protein